MACRSLCDRCLAYLSGAEKEVVLWAQGDAVTKCISVAELVKRRCPTRPVHQITTIGSEDPSDVSPPQITIVLSLKRPASTPPLGYQVSSGPPL